jgi:hypothetical protein
LSNRSANRRQIEWLREKQPKLHRRGKAAAIKLGPDRQTAESTTASRNGRVTKLDIWGLLVMAAIVLAGAIVFAFKVMHWLL